MYKIPMDQTDVRLSGGRFGISTSGQSGSVIVELYDNDIYTETLYLGSMSSLEYLYNDVFQGNKILMIKFIRAGYSFGLKEAKDLVEGLFAEPLKPFTFKKEKNLITLEARDPSHAFDRLRDIVKNTWGWNLQ
jgi:hypothetical protein